MVKLTVALLQVQHIVELAERLRPGVLQAQVGGDGRAGLALDALALLAAEEAKHVLDQLQILAPGGSGVTKAVGDGPPSVAGGGIGALRQHGDIPLAHHVGVVLHLAEQVPAAFKEHGAHAGEESRAGAGLGEVVLVGTPVVLLDGHIIFDGLHGGGLGVPGMEIGIRVQYVTAVLVDEIPVAQLLVVIGHVAVLAGSVVNLLGGVGHIVPGPILGGIGHAGSVKHLLVVDKDHVVLILGDAVNAAVCSAGVADGDIRKMVLVVT